MAGLSEQWGLACEGQGQVAFLVGTAGIGKSRLSLALSQLAAEQRGIVLSYQCSELYQSSALYPVLDRLRRDAGIRHLDPPETQIAKLRKLLGDGADAPAANNELCEYMLDIQVSRTAGGNRKSDDLQGEYTSADDRAVEARGRGSPLPARDRGSSVDRSHLARASRGRHSTGGRTVFVRAGYVATQSSRRKPYRGCWRQVECRDISSRTTQRGAELNDHF